MMEIREADLSLADDTAAVVELLDEYARHPMGQAQALSDEARARLIPGLRNQPGALVLLACEGADRIGVAVCFRGFSTFAGLPLINVHDLAVTAGHRRKGVGRALLEDVLRRAGESGCAKVTLEVRDDNLAAKSLYKRMDFGPWRTPMLFVGRRVGSHSSHMAAHGPPFRRPG